jgi:hypothetical protein
MEESRSLRDRVAGQSAMRDVVLAQSVASPRSRALRILGANPLTPVSRLSYRGALGELLVGDVLENLGQRWDVLHDLSLGETILDHLVIGPAGVFTVHTANYSEQDVVVNGSVLLVDGEPRYHIGSAMVEAEAASRLLTAATGVPVRVRPLVVVVEPKRISVKASAAPVRVIASYQLERMLTRAVATLCGDEVALISDHADLATTWPSAETPGLDTQQLHRDFADVRAQVRSALVRRIFWTAMGIGALYTVVLVLVSSFITVILHA